MTLIYEFDLDIVKTYWHTKSEVSISKLSKVRAQTEQTDRHD